jgi:hypothetical protein
VHELTPLASSIHALAIPARSTLVDQLQLLLVGIVVKRGQRDNPQQILFAVVFELMTYMCGHAS